MFLLQLDRHHIKALDLLSALVPHKRTTCPTFDLFASLKYKLMNTGSFVIISK